MNNDELDQRLRSARVPERDAEYWENFPSHVVSTLERRSAIGESESRARPRWSVPLISLCALAAAVLVFGFVIGRGRFSDAQRPAPWLKDQTALREVLTLFPNRVRAI